MSLIHGDCIEAMAGMEPESVDAVVTDPPYNLVSIGQRFGKADAAPVKDEAFGGRYTRLARGFMGKTWDGDGIAFRPETWAAMLRVAKPSSYLLAFGGTRTVHRMTTAIEDAGWIIRDMLVWAYASGFPKSKASLKPAWEPIVMARKPGPLRELAIDACRIGTDELSQHGRNDDAFGFTSPEPPGREWTGRWPANVILTATEWYSLRDDVDQSVRECIAAYFEAQGVGVDDVPRVRQGVRDHAGVGQGRAAEVLLPTMQLEGVPRGEAGRAAPQRGVKAADEGREHGPLPRAELAGVEGRTLVRPARVRVGGDLGVDGSGARPSGSDGTEAREGTPVHSGAPATDGDNARPAPDELRGSPPPQRDQGRQPADEPVSPGPVEPHAGAPDGGPGARPTPRASRRAGSRERGVTVPLDLIPPGWRRYFQFSHDSGIFDGGWEGVVGGGETTSGLGTRRSPAENWSGGFVGPDAVEATYGDSGTYSRFFVLPKADRADREPVLGGLIEARAPTLGISNVDDWTNGSGKPGKPPQPRANSHPTVKPVDLMRHLVRLVTPTGGVVLDPFAGSGSTLLAAEMEGFQWIGIEKEAEYVAIAEARLNGTQRGLGLPA